MMSEILFTQQQIQNRVNELAFQIESFYKAEESNLVVIVVYNGAMFFAADLLKQVKLNCCITGVQASSYKGGMKSTGRVEFINNINVKDKHVLIVDDIYDTGNTLYTLSNDMRESGALTVEVCVLLTKQIPKTHAVDVLFSGFDILNMFVYGYGLDINDRFRNLEYIARA